MTLHWGFNQEEPTPAHRMLRLDALCWWLVGKPRTYQLSTLWRRVGDFAEVTRAMTLRWWASINEYVTDRIGISVHHSKPAAYTVGSH